MLISILRKQRRESHDKVQHKSVIGESDVKLLRSSGIFIKGTPLSLLRGVWFHVAIHWCRRGREGLRALTPKSFEMLTDDTVRCYYKMTHEELTKNHPGGLSNDENYEADIRMYDTNNKNDGFHLLEFCLTKVNAKCPSLFQYPTRNFSRGSQMWCQQDFETLYEPLCANYNSNSPLRFESEKPPHHGYIGTQE